MQAYDVPGSHNGPGLQAGLFASVPKGLSVFLQTGRKRYRGPLHGPGQMSFSNCVPAAVPSVFQSSMPFTPSLAWK